MVSLAGVMVMRCASAGNGAELRPGKLWDTEAGGRDSRHKQSGEREAAPNLDAAKGNCPQFSPQAMPPPPRQIAYADREV
ncbi:hypothetical protein SKAU_G00311700 [Synaphobranchus kaupii]|uniref:Uncharacterized protein n=1 Tax=Synaphobranchus kaupii TaxID=118154 RepID=A0A9Q1IKC9_SYNKA|nr:hypothetical protein SKAU_G00311700 [Synaphobranchus kaupii]